MTNKDQVSQSEFHAAVQNVVNEIRDMLIFKNKKYGNSALKPIRIFSKADSLEQLNVRIDDKLSRVNNRKDEDDEDVEKDLIGYLILKRIALRKKPTQDYGDFKKLSTAVLETVLSTNDTLTDEQRAHIQIIMDERWRQNENI